MRNELLFDTSFAVARASPKDQFYPKAKFWSDKIQAENISVVVTQAVILEIGNALSKLQFRQVGIGLLKSFEKSENIIVISMTNELYDKAFEIFRSRPDKEWGLVDCVSFVVMQERKITDALTADEHFTQAGFRALLTEK
ncbi:MAG: PIN domain-containing protein [Pyrinomonadaceae bacterium]|nr:PIN domain-containing protein [Pyrinomonadaceae bacterium]